MVIILSYSFKLPKEFHSSLYKLFISLFFHVTKIYVKNLDLEDNCIDVNSKQDNNLCRSNHKQLGHHPLVKHAIYNIKHYIVNMTSANITLQNITLNITL